MTSLYKAIVQNNLGFFIKYIVKTSPLSELIKIEKVSFNKNYKCVQYQFLGIVKTIVFLVLVQKSRHNQNQSWLIS